MNIRICEATNDDSAVLSRLIESVARRFCFEHGTEIPVWFLESLRPSAIAEQIADETFNYLVAMHRDELVGVLVIRHSNHIHHLFVSPAMHKQGIAHALWNGAKLRYLAPPNITVRSSLYAVPAYERFGFKKSGQPAEKDGLVYQPMHLNHI